MSIRLKVLIPASVCCFFLFRATCPGVVGGPQASPYVSDDFSDASQSATLWNFNGNTQENYGLQVSDPGGASLISTVPVPDGSSQYSAGFSVGAGGPDNPGGTYVLYLEATQNALLNMNGSSSGSFYAFAIQAASTDNGCQAQITLYKAVDGTVSTLAGTSLGCARYYVSFAGADGSLRLMTIAQNGQYYEPLVWTDTSNPLSGAAGIGAAGPGDGSAVNIWVAALYPMDRVPPTGIPGWSAQTYLRPAEVDIRTAPSQADPNGFGLYEYQWYRDGELVNETFLPEYTDVTVEPGSTHVYGVNAIDLYGNTSSTTSFTITTPTTAAVDPREIGVRPTGSYWGEMGEQVDVRSGNLNPIHC
jgi:hypothetical protein